MNEKMSPKDLVAEHAGKFFGSSSPDSVYEYAKIHRDSYTDPKLNAEVERILKEATPEVKKESARGEKQLRDLIDKEGISRSTSGKLTPSGGGGRGGSLGSSGPKNLGGKIPEMRKGGSVKSASARADGIAQKGKTKGRIV